MKCEKCGEQIPENLNYCPLCEIKQEQNLDVNQNIAYNSSTAENDSNSIETFEVSQNSLTNESAVNLSTEMQPNDNNQLQNIESPPKKDKILKIFKYILPIDLITIILYILMFYLPGTLNISSWDSLGLILFAQIGIQVGTIILSLILTTKFISKNFRQSKTGKTFKVIINSISTYFLYLIVSYFISITLNLIAYSQGNNTNNILLTTYILPILLPLIIIPISSFLNRNNEVTNKNAYMIGILLMAIYISQYILTLHNVGIDLQNSISLDNGLFYLTYQIVSIIHVPLVAIIPAFISSLVNFKVVEVNAEKRNVKEVIILIISIILYIIVTKLPFDNALLAIDENKSIPTQSTKDNFTYCIIPYKTKGGIYYQAYDNNDCWKRDKYLSSQDSKYNQSIFYVDTNSLDVKAYVSNVHTIYNFNGKTENLYYTLENAGPLYELKNDGSTTNIIKSRNPRIVFYHDNQIYYQDYMDDTYKYIDINSYTINTIDSAQMNTILFGFNDDIYYKNPNQYFKLNRYNVKTKMIESITDDNINELTQNGGNYYGGSNDFYFENNILYYVRLNKDSYIYKYNLKTYQIEKEKINTVDNYYDVRVRVIGIYDNDLYFIAWDTGYNGQISIHKVNLLTNNAEVVVEAAQVHSTISDESYYQKISMAQLMYENTAIIDGYLYYNEYSTDNGKIYRLNLSSGSKEKLNNDANSVFFDLIDGYVYYVTNNYSNKSNSFYRIKDMKRETIVENIESTTNTDESRTPWTPTIGNMDFMLSDCELETKDKYISDYYLAKDVICGIHLYKNANGTYPTSVADLKPYIGNAAVFKSNYEIELDGESPTKSGVIVTSYNRNCREENSNYISAWILRPGGETGMYCVSGH